ncbi:hypothetical protein BDW22DRAFT_1335904, partial [Trametopsis cervina]
MIRASPLTGYQIPGMKERIITTLFADDTTVYLSQWDHYSDLQDILKLWCRASKAKFNLEKTMVIPIGTSPYRNSVIMRANLPDGQEPLPPEVTVAKDKTMTRILGAWIGNDIDPMAPWQPVLKSLKQRLLEWGRTNPTPFGRRLIANMEVGGRTQYLSKVQGMPLAIQNEITSIIRTFMWPDQTTPPINLSTLQRPIREGGLALIDIKARAKATLLTWLQPFLNLSESRPAWAYVADCLLALNAKKSGPQYDNETKLQYFLQNWSVNASANSNLPRPLKALLNLAKEYNVSLSTIKMNPTAKKKMPLWLH